MAETLYDRDKIKYMPTRKELIEDLELQMQDLTYAVNENTNKQDSIGEFSDQIKEYSDRQVKASNDLSDSIIAGAGTILAGLISGAAMLIYGGVIYLFVKAMIEKLKEINQKTSMIKSIIKIQHTKQQNTYNYFLERTYVDGSDTELRRTILNGLIENDILTIYYQDENEFARIDEDNPALLEYWEKLSEIKDSLEKVVVSLRKDKSPE